MNKEVSVIGASAAGLFTSLLLAKKGLSSKIFEANNEISPEPRTLIVTNRVREILGPLCRGAIMNKIKRFELFADGKAATVHLAKPDLVMERYKIIEILAEQCEASGVQIRSGKELAGINIDGPKPRISFRANGNGRNIDMSTDVLVGADGALSKVARCMGHEQPHLTHLYQTTVKLPGDMDPESTRVWFLPEMTPYFCWLIPHSPAEGVFGLIAEEEDNGREYFEYFIKKKNFRTTGQEIQKGPIPRYRGWVPLHKKVGAGAVYLVGDAASHVKVSTIGGLVTGFRGALGVAESVLNGGHSPTLTKLRIELESHRLLRKILHGFGQDDYVSLLGMLNRPTKRMLGHLTRDETPRLLANAVIRQPRLLLLGLRGLVRAGNVSRRT